MTWRVERRLFAWDPDLVPLVTLSGDERWDHGEGAWRVVPHGSRIHCYRLSEIAAGRTTVVGVPWDHRNDGVEPSVEPSGQSLLTVLHEYVVGRLRLDEWEITQPSNWGAGSIDDDEVEGSRQWVAAIEGLQRRLVECTGPTAR